ncbi:nitrate ABC transporter permease [Sphaerisporangium siamense]|uniref:ABC-type nitrate/sulfonate/bicarbonate transport system permease component n=1 Tax=Sphaerisporangium siamense TaxID=795645 RepID=A0A7W7GDX7_9ACTN|nr:ABC transporter permease [Sphaerisporangium siamense]MBB4703466.1 ABC-type nitrate/sulfonate/bicarbonate transport system permease component [Sphaerisporangium siamense]GII87540.1 nitrate ABC transporter permease [Sphaerisporangium siamense]
MASPRTHAPPEVTAVLAPPLRGRGTTRPAPPWVLPTATVVGVLVAAELVIRSGVVGTHFPTITATGRALGREVTQAGFWTAMGETTYAWLAGFGLATLIAIPLGLGIASSRFAFRSSRLLIDFLRPIPPVAILPLAVLVLGTGTQMKIWLVVFSALWPVLFQTIYGAQDVDPVARDTARAYGLSRLERYRYVVVPSAAPYIATGLRLAATIALVVTIATELIVGSAGLGYRINQVRYADDTPAMYALIFVAGILGWLITVCFRYLEKRLLHWHHSQRVEAGR